MGITFGSFISWICRSHTWKQTGWRYLFVIILSRYRNRKQRLSRYQTTFRHFVILSKLVRYVRLDIRPTPTTAGYSLVKAQNLARRARGWVPAISAPNKTLGGDCWRDEETRVEMREYARYLSM